MQILPILIFLANDFLHIHRYELIQLPSGTSLSSWQSTSHSMTGFHFFNIAMHMYQPRWKPHHDMPLSVHTFQDTEYCHTVFVKCISRSLERNAWSWKESYMLQRDSGSFLNYLNFDNFWIFHALCHAASNKLHLHLCEVTTVVVMSIYLHSRFHSMW